MQTLGEPAVLTFDGRGLGNSFAFRGAGPLPIAPGLLRSTLQRRLVGLLGALVSGNWRLARLF